MNARNVLFVTWDGPNAPFLLGLFLPIFVALRAYGYRFHVLQFGWSSAEEKQRVAEACAAAGVPYRGARVWRRPVAPGALLTALLGRGQVRRAIRDWQIDLLMPRSTLAGLAAIPAAGKGARRTPVLLDADGLPHDERVEFGGASRAGLSYRLLRRLEAWSVRRADAITVRTRRAANILAERAGGTDLRRFHVIANARDEMQFTPSSNEERTRRRAELGVGTGEPLLVFVASSLSWKNDSDAMLRFLRSVRARWSEARLLLLVPSQDEARALLARHPDLDQACISRSATLSEMPRWIACADLGLALMHTTFSMQAVAPVKLGEYLLCGVPVLASAGVGDTGDIVDAGIGRCIDAPDDAELERAAAWFVATVLADRDGFRERCRAFGLAHFALSTAVKSYDGALRAALA